MSLNMQQPPTQIIQRLEELTLNTAPAIHQNYYDGWILRASNTETHRANSVTALHASTLPLSDKLAYCESWYRQHHQPALFRVNDSLSPAGLDDLLATRGYTPLAATHVMTADLTSDTVPHEVPPGVRLVELDLAESLAALHRLKGTAPNVAEQEIKRQALWCGPQMVLSLRSINGVVCSGMARVESGHVGIFDIYTPAHQRGKGFAAMLVSQLLAWGKNQGASSAFLQVLETNSAAIAVYERLGFAACYRYWSRAQGGCETSSEKC